MRHLLLMILATALATLPTQAAAADPGVTMPKDWRNWQHVKSMVIEPGHPLAGLVEGTHHIYANPKAMAGYRKRPFPDGAVIVFDLLTTQHGDLAITEGPRKAVIVMQKDSKRFSATNGWGYEVFAQGDRTKPQVGAKAAQMCHACHISQRNRDYVFSDFRN
ncbi:MAG: cytochrome P460 family protein [Steroidobacteraceae bacterium]